MTPASFGSNGPSRQQGVISVLTAFLLMILLVLLALVADTGRLYLEKRTLQKIVDLAALDASARLPQGYCAGGIRDDLHYANEFARQSAEMNNFSVNDDNFSASCATVETNSEGLRTITSNPSEGGAVQVTASKRVPASIIIRGGALFSSEIFDKEITISAISTAQRSQRSDPTAAFSVSTRLLSLDNEALVGKLLSTVGLTAEDLELFGPRGVLDTTVTPSGLLEALGIEVSIDELGVLTPGSIIDASGLEVKRIVEVSAGLIGNEALAAQVSAISTKLIDTSLETVDLFGENGLIHLTGGSREGTRAALETGLDLGELLGLTLIAGSGEKSLEIPGLDLLGITIAAGITEPPALAVGPVGTKAYTGQVRLHIDIDTDKIIGVNLLTGLTGLIGLPTRIHLPLTLELAKAEATLEAIDCSVEPPTVDISVSSSLLEACVGQMPESNDGESLWIGSESCITAVQDTDLISLLGIPLGPKKLIIRGSEDAENTPNIIRGLAAGQEYSYTTATPVALGSIVTDLIASLVGLLDSNASNSSDQALAELIADEYMDASKTGSEFTDDDLPTLISLVLDGDDTQDPPIPSLADEDWTVPNYACSFLCLGTKSGPFSQAIYDLSNNSGLLLGQGRNDYQSCSALLGGATFTPYNDCVKDNLALMLQRKPGGLDLAEPVDPVDADGTVNCNTFICNLIRIPLNSVSKVLTDLISGGLGLELGRTDVHVESISCGVPTLVQ